MERRAPQKLLAYAILLIMVQMSAADDVGPVKQDDAGSGRDAPDHLSNDILILPDTLYQGASTGLALDRDDVYHFTGAADQYFHGMADGNLGCYRLLDALGLPLAYACSYGGAPINQGPLAVRLPYTGDYYFHVIHSTPSVYQFGFSLTGAAPDARLLALFGGAETPTQPEQLEVPQGCDKEYSMVSGGLIGGGSVPKFSDDCYHMRTGLNQLDTADIDVLILPPASLQPERDIRVMRQAVEMWDEGIQMLAPQMDLHWLTAVDFDIFPSVDDLSVDPVVHPEIVVVTSNPVGGIGIGIGTDPTRFIFNGEDPCDAVVNPLATFEDWKALPGFDSHHDGSGTFVTECDVGGSICFAVNGAIDGPFIGGFGLYDLVAHEFGHCLTVGHVGDALDHKANKVPYADIMAYTDQSFDKCVSTLDVQGFALTMSSLLLATPLEANHAAGPGGSFQIQHPDDHWYASTTGLARDCPQPDDGLLPGSFP